MHILTVHTRSNIDFNPFTSYCIHFMLVLVESDFAFRNINNKILMILYIHMYK